MFLYALNISISVPVRFLGEDSCIGVKMHGGAISRLINDIDITCLASNLPEYLEVDISELDVGDSIFLSGLSLPEGVEIPSKHIHWWRQAGERDWNSVPESK